MRCGHRGDTKHRQREVTKSDGAILRAPTRERMRPEVIGTQLRPASAPKASGRALEYRPRPASWRWGRFLYRIQVQDCRDGSASPGGEPIGAPPGYSTNQTVHLALRFFFGFFRFRHQFFDGFLGLFSH